MKLTRKPLVSLAAWLFCGFPFDAVSASFDTGFSSVAPSILGERLAVDDAMLDEIRGGFTTTSGLQVTFGIERVLYVNGTLISTTSINVLDLGNTAPAAPVIPDVAANLPDVDKLSKPAMALPQTTSSAPAAANPVNEVANTAQPVTTSSVVSAPAVAETGIPSTSTSAAMSSTTTSSTTTSSASSSVVVANTSVVASGAPTVGEAASSTPAATTTSAAPTLALIQSGAGNVVSSNTMSASSVGTVIQNTLNDQKIQNVTIVNATVNSMEIFKEMNLQSAISTAINDSVRK